MGLADYLGPAGWRGVAEMLGWTGVCVAAGLGVAALLGRWREGGVRRYAAVAAATMAVVAFTYAPYWLGLHAPTSAKILFTTSLQVVGSLTAVGLVLWFAFLIWDDCRGS